MVPEDEPGEPERNSFLTGFSRIAMGAGLVAAYGTFAAILARFLYPARPAPRGWMFVATVDRFRSGASLVFRTPAGETVNITRQGSGASAADFVALSSVCPHLGCQVHWEPQNDRYFCPCHNGVFNPEGVATEGPPAEAGQSLLEYPLKVEGNLLFIEVALSQLALGPGRLEEPFGEPGPGHDPCLLRSRRA